MSKAIEDVLFERGRQVDEEGWTPEHDDEHDSGEMAIAASCYAHPRMWNDPRINEPHDWPWPGTWKPKDRRRNLVRAAALIIAEIERLDRHGYSVEKIRAEKHVSGSGMIVVNFYVGTMRFGLPVEFRSQEAADQHIKEVTGK